MSQPDLSDLLSDLASSDPSVVEEAGFALRGRSDGVRPLLELLPTLDAFGKLTAIETIESWPVDMARRAVDPTVAEVMLPLLHDDVDTVREWASNVLAWIGDRDAVPEIEAALRRSRSAGVPPDWTEPVALRHALLDLGARERVLPARAKSLAQHDPKLGVFWPARDLRDVVDSLAEANQLVLYVQEWRRERDTFSWVSSLDFKVELAGEWREVVTSGQAEAVRAVGRWSPVDGSVVTIEWIGETDR